jgi:hypothetical protein
MINQEKHGMSKHLLYGIRKSMIQRTSNPKCEHFPQYGGRGIKVCDDWLKSPSKFFEWAMENGYKKGLSIDRIDVNGNYCPENCRWITQKEQTRNTRRNNFLTLGKETMCIQDWAEKLGFSHAAGIRNRLKRGWSLEKTLTTPQGKETKYHYFLLNGKKVNLSKIGKITGFNVFNYYARTKRGLTNIKDIFKEVDFNRFVIEKVK